MFSSFPARFDALSASLTASFPPAKQPTPGTRLPGCRHFLTACQKATTVSPDIANIVTLLKRVEPHLHWIQSPGRETLGPSYMDNYCYSNLLGIQGLVPHQTVACGFLIIGPNQLVI